MTTKLTPRRSQGILPLFMQPRAIWRFMWDPRVGWGSKLALLVAVVYTVFPLDFVPDVIPIIGWLDDAGVVSAAVAWLAASVQAHARAHEQGSETDSNAGQSA